MNCEDPYCHSRWHKGEKLMDKKEFEATILEFGKWLRQLDKIAIENGYEGSVSWDCGIESWSGYFIDQCTPQEAWAEELRFC